MGRLPAQLGQHPVQQAGPLEDEQSGHPHAASHQGGGGIEGDVVQRGLGVQAVKRLLEKINHNSREVLTIEIFTFLVERQSIRNLNV